jgi:hypothetical protein
MRKGKLGLQKEVSKIFTGIQIPRKDASDTDVRSVAPAAPIASVPDAPIAPALPVSVPVASAPAPVAPAPAKYISPKPAVAAPRPFTIPESMTQSTPQASKQTVYEPPKPYEPPAPPTVPVSPVPVSEKQPVLRQHREPPFLKIWGQVKAKLLNPKQGASPARQKMMILVAPVLMVVFLLVVVQAIKKSPGTTANSSKKASSAGAFNGKINWELPAVIPDNLRNPIVLGTTGQGKGITSGPVVKGIVYSEDKSCAVVGDRVVSAGDTVGGATIIKINPDSVEFTMGDKNWTQKVEH